jgi:hypothetical protein
MPRLSWSALATLSLASTACFDPESGRLDSTAGTSSSPTTDPSTTALESTTTAVSTTSLDGTSGGTTDDGGTTMPLDGTSTGIGSTSIGSTSEATTAVESSSGEGSSEGSTSMGMACSPSLGDFINPGDAWQSFTADDDGDIVEVDFYWNLGGLNDAFTINIYEGEGTGGMLLHSQVFPGQGRGVWVGFDINVLGTPVPITAGSVYTVQGVETFGWQTASGGVPGGSSSLGAGQHKNIRVWIEPCE